MEHIEKTDESFCFAVAGDPHYGKYDYSADVFKWVVGDVNIKDFEFLVVNGDLTQSGFDGQYRDYFDAINQSDVPVVSVIGNHDVRFGGRSRYENMFGTQTYFDFTVGDYQFIILDSADKELGTEQLNWLDTQLQEHYKDIIITHYPRAELADADHLTSLIEEHAPELVIYSHNHRYYTTQIGETEFIVTDSSGGGDFPESYVSLCVTDEGVKHEQVFTPFIVS